MHCFFYLGVYIYVLRFYHFASFVSIHFDIMQFHINQHQIILITQNMMIYYKNNDALIIPQHQGKNRILFRTA